MNEYIKRDPTEQARASWRALGRGRRRAIIRAARRGRPWENSDEALLALGWASAVLGPPEKRKQLSALAQFFDVIFAVLAPSSNLGDIFDGDPANDENPFVRRAARKVESENLHMSKSKGGEE
jgi:hypothetical protein